MNSHRGKPSEIPRNSQRDLWSILGTSTSRWPLQKIHHVKKVLQTLASWKKVFFEFNDSNFYVGELFDISTTSSLVGKCDVLPFCLFNTFIFGWKIRHNGESPVKFTHNCFKTVLQLRNRSNFSVAVDPMLQAEIEPS